MKHSVSVPSYPALGVPNRGGHVREERWSDHGLNTFPDLKPFVRKGLLGIRKDVFWSTIQLSGHRFELYNPTHYNADLVTPKTGSWPENQIWSGHFHCLNTHLTLSLTCYFFCRGSHRALSRPPPPSANSTFHHCVLDVGLPSPELLEGGDRICSVHLASHRFVGRINGIS